MLISFHLLISGLVVTMRKRHNEPVSMQKHPLQVWGTGESVCCWQGYFLREMKFPVDPGAQCLLWNDPHSHAYSWILLCFHSFVCTNSSPSSHRSMLQMMWSMEILRGLVRKSSTFSTKVHGSLFLNMLLKQNAHLERLSFTYRILLIANKQSPNWVIVERNSKALYSQLHSEKALQESMNTPRHRACGSNVRLRLQVSYKENSSSSWAIPLHLTKSVLSRSLKFALKWYHVHLKKLVLTGNDLRDNKILPGLRILQTYFSHALYFSLRKWI